MQDKTEKGDGIIELKVWDELVNLKPGEDLMSEEVYTEVLSYNEAA